MTETTSKMDWNAEAKAKYDLMITKIPMFHREIAKTVVDKQAEINAKERGSGTIEEDDIVRAFISEVPKAFYSLMARLFDEVGLNYKDR